MPGPREFDIHLFISYEHIDNQPLTAELAGPGKPISRVARSDVEHADGSSCPNLAGPEAVR